MKKTYLLFTLFTAFSLFIQAQDVFKVDKLYYTVLNASEQTVKVVPEMYPTLNYKSGNRPTGEVVIPKTVVNPNDSKTYTVTAVNKYCFAWSEEMTKITVANTVEKIDSFAFQKCTSLKNLEFEDGSRLTRIYRSMCEYCSNLEEIVIPPNVTVIEDWAFLECSSLETVTWSKELKVLYEFSFRDCAGLYDILTPAAYPPTFASADPQNRPEGAPGWVFYGTPISDIELTVPVGAKKNYTGYPWDAFLKINEKNIPASVKNLNGNLDITFVRDGNNIIISNLTANEKLQIFDLSGKLIFDLRPANTSETLQIESGAYVIKAGNKSDSVLL